MTVLVPSAVFAIGLAGCGQGTDDAITMSEIATAAVSGAANSGSAGTQAFRPTRKRSMLASLGAFLDPVPPALAGNLRCPTVLTASGSNCSVDETGKVLTLAYAECNFGNNSAVWNGAEILTSSATVSCGSLPSVTPGATLLRTFAPGTTRTIGNSVHVTSLDTTEPSGWETPVSGGMLITFQNDSVRSIAIRGVHVVSQKIFRGIGNAGRVQTAADHTVSTALDQPVQVAVTPSGRVVNGTVVAQHNLEKYTGSSVFKDVTYAEGCCLPQSGSVTTTFAGSRTGTETLEFAATECGAAKMTDEKGGLRDVTLTRCL